MRRVTLLPRSIEARLLLGVLLAYAYFLPRVTDWNGNSRMDLTLAIVEEGGFAIDSFYENTGDYSRFGGHIYTDKAPGLSLLAAAPYAAYRWLAGWQSLRAALSATGIGEALAEVLRETGSRRRQSDLARRLRVSEDREATGPPLGGPWRDAAGWRLHFAGALYICTLAVVALPCALACVVLYRFLAAFGASPPPRLLATLAYGFGTAAFPYASVFYGQQLAAALLLLAWERLHALRRGGAASAWWFVAGALLGLAVLTELTAAVPAAFLALYGLGAGRARGIALLVAGGLPFAVLLGAYNAACFGSPFATGYRHLGRFPEIAAYGIVGFGAPRLEALLGLTLHPIRGLFVYSPFLLLALPGWKLLWRGQRAEATLGLAAFAAQLLLIAGWHDWQGGAALGPRNLLVVIPFLIIPTAVAFEAWWSDPGRRLMAAAAVAASGLVLGTASVSAGDFPPASIANPLVDYFLPRLLAGELTPNLLMLAGLDGATSLLGLSLPLLLIGSAWRLAARSA